MPTYLRFVVADIHEDSGKNLVRSMAFSGCEKKENFIGTKKICTILRDNVSTRIWRSPPSLQRQKLLSTEKPNKAISWFKDTAKDHALTLGIWSQFSRYGIGVQS
jgi:hypothetical protein